MLERATKLEPGLSTAWARLAKVGIWEVVHNWTDSPERTLPLPSRARAYAVDLDPRDAEARIELSFALMTAGDGNAAIEEARRSLKRNPSHIMAQLFHAYMWHMTGHPCADRIELVQPRDATQPP